MTELPRGTVVIIEPETFIRIQSLMSWHEELVNVIRCVSEGIYVAPDDDMAVVNVLISALSQLDSVTNDLHDELQACREHGTIVSF
jgi:hypothetical protein